MGDWASGQVLPDIPRIYTALAEWLACVMCILEMKHCFRNGVRTNKENREEKVVQWKWFGIAAFFLIIQSLFLVVTEAFTGVIWILCMMIAVLLMYLFIYVSCDVSGLYAAYTCVRAFVLAEFAASLEWQMDCFCYYGMGYTQPGLKILLFIGLYGVVYGGMWWISKRYFLEDIKMDIEMRECLLAAIVGLSVFLMSNIGFVYSNTPFSGRYSADIFNVRTLIDFGGMAILYAYHIQRLYLRAKYERDKTEMILHNQYIQYQQSQETLDLINYKYHDLKNHIIALRAEENEEKKVEYLDKLEADIGSYGAQQRTGHPVLDTLLTSKSLYCMKNEIGMTAVVDGTLLEFMDVMDICSIFGNALDNAIECENKIADKEKRMIHLSVFAQKAFLMIRFENYCEDELEFERDLPVTTKKQMEFHGYGLKSLYYAVHKYNGEVTIDLEDNWFRLSILIPI